MTQHKLIQDTNRPYINIGQYGEEIFTELCEKVAEDIVEWDNKIDKSDVFEAVKGVLKHNWDYNGYELAKELEETTTIAPDAILVDLLDMVHNYLSEITTKYTKQWVIENEIVLKYDLGRVFDYKDRKHGHVKAKIVKLYPEEAKYGAWFKELGEEGKTHLVLKSEDVER